MCCFERIYFKTSYTLWKYGYEELCQVRNMTDSQCPELTRDRAQLILSRGQMSRESIDILAAVTSCSRAAAARSNQKPNINTQI